MRPAVGLNDILRTVSKLRAALDSLRKREAGEIECSAAELPYSLNLKNFRTGDRIVVVTSGWMQDDAVRPVTLHTEVTREGDGHVLTITAYGPDGGRLPGDATVHVSWIAMA